MGVVAIVGPTAAAKSRLAMQVARRFGGEIISVDSMQVYRGLDIGTAKPSRTDRKEVPHHLIDIVDPAVTFSVAEHQRMGVAAIEDIEARRAVPLVVGGSGLHFRALVDPLEFPPTDATVRAEIEALEPEDAVVALLAADPDAARLVDLANPRRVARALEIHRITGATPSARASSTNAAAVRNYEPRFPLRAFGLDPGDRLEERVTARFDSMLHAGLVEEVERMQNRLGVTAAQGVGYKQLLPVVRGRATLEEGRRAAISATMGLAKRQRTFFRRDPRITWIPWHDGDDTVLEHGLAAITVALEEMAWTS